MQLTCRLVRAGLLHLDHAVDERIDCREGRLQLANSLPLLKLALALLAAKEGRFLVGLLGEPLQGFLDVPAGQVDLTRLASTIKKRVSDCGLVMKRLHRKHGLGLTLLVGQFGASQLIVEPLGHNDGHEDDCED